MEPGIFRGASFFAHFSHRFNAPLTSGVYDVPMIAEHSFALRLDNLTVRYGPGCPRCREGRESMERNRCLFCGTIWALRDVSLRLREGEILGVVGESGSGKSTLMQALYLDNEPGAGTYHLGCYQEGAVDVFSVSPQQKKIIRNRLLGMVYQNPHRGLRMFFSSGANVAEKLIAAGNRNVASMMERTAGLLEHIEVSVSRIREPPAHFSGGMQQRVQIAKAVANNPPLLFLDEVTTGLDLSVQARVLDLIKRIQREYGVSMIVVSHDLAVVRMLSERAIVMLDGEIVEEGITDQIMEDPRHVYTQTLVNSLL
jgi:putative phosphonate transport system ATP-binding protein